MFFGCKHGHVHEKPRYKVGLHPIRLEETVLMLYRNITHGKRFLTDLMEKLECTMKESVLPNLRFTVPVNIRSTDRMWIVKGNVLRGWAIG